MKVLMSAGPTVEPIDPVRFISNRSSGAMAVAIASALTAHGHEVVVVHGPLAVEIPAEGTWLPVQTAMEMLKKLEEHAPECDVFILAAAVCDMRPARSSTEKLEKSRLSRLDLEPNPDIAQTLARAKGADQLMITFSLENGWDLSRPLEKMRSKGADWAVVNDLSSMGGGQGKFALLSAEGVFLLTPETMSKKDFATKLVSCIEARTNPG
ncbi:MAG: phosphopantothenoylcysteine decarboxylase [Planctomycetes bacterium]|nr:phosphopantothenoylcysteine decarboxylase [Planctomycetota bacterium]